MTDPRTNATLNVLAAQRNEALDMVARMAGTIAVYETELKALKQQLAAIEAATKENRDATADPAEQS